MTRASRTASTLTLSRPREPRVSIVVPALNEARNLEAVLPQLPPVHEVILVDGGSTDDTIDAALTVMPGIRVVHQTRIGKGNALACGFAAVTGDVVVMFDADGSADPAEIPRFVDALVAGADFAKGSRFRAGGGSDDITRLRSLGNKGLNLVTNILFGTRFSDLCYGYNAFWADMIPLLNLPDLDAHAPEGKMLWGDGFEIETVINCRFAVARAAISEVPSVEKLRIHGASNLNAVSDGLRVLRTILSERRRAVGYTAPQRVIELVEACPKVTPIPIEKVAVDLMPIGHAKVIDLRTGPAPLQLELEPWPEVWVDERTELPATARAGHRA